MVWVAVVVVVVVVVARNLCGCFVWGYGKKGVGRGEEVFCATPCGDFWWCDGFLVCFQVWFYSLRIGGLAD